MEQEIKAWVRANAHAYQDALYEGGVFTDFKSMVVDLALDTGATYTVEEMAEILKDVEEDELSKYE